MQMVTELRAYLRCGRCIMHKARNASESIINEPKLHLDSMHNLSVRLWRMHSHGYRSHLRERGLQVWSSRLGLSV